jgi:hypothetical protein
MAIIQRYPNELDYVNAVVRECQRHRSFIWYYCDVCLRADWENYEILRPALLIFMEKYPADPNRLEAERRDREAHR